MELGQVTSAYRRWAPVYDQTFGRIAHQGRRRAIDHVNRGSGRVLEVGVGTGLALPLYAPHLQVVGVDYSHEMLDRARSRTRAEKLGHVVELRQMDARTLDFPDGAFDTVVAMYLVSVVPEPERVVAEMARVCKPGGQVLIVNHFARTAGPLAAIEKAFAPFAGSLGWHPDFPIAKVLGVETLRLQERTALPPAGLFTLLTMQRIG
jgi:phosphatidylethanolamine/phosphatidyl-N-methylethanolamine N-methyltransferase